jgi:hypothetical protein
MWLADQAAVSLVDTTITDNTTASYGGGAMLGSDRFNLPQMRAAVRRNTAPVEADICAMPSQISIANGSTVVEYVSRLRVDEGLINVTVLVTGPHRLPSASVGVTAMLDDVVLRKASSGNDGLVHLPVKLLKPPGALRMGLIAMPSRACQIS